jgi:hypothetical protein
MFFGLCAERYCGEKANSGQGKHFIHSLKSPERCDENMEGLREKALRKDNNLSLRKSIRGHNNIFS